MLGGEEASVFEVSVDGGGQIESKYLRFVFHESRTDGLECARVLYEGLFVSVLIYGSETVLRREKEKSRARAE